MDVMKMDKPVFRKTKLDIMFGGFSTVHAPIRDDDAKERLKTIGGAIPIRCMRREDALAFVTSETEPAEARWWMQQLLDEYPDALAVYWSYWE